MAASTDLDTLLGPEPPQDWPHEPGTWWTSTGVLATMTGAFIVAAIIATGRHDPGKRRKSARQATREVLDQRPAAPTRSTQPPAEHDQAVLAATLPPAAHAGRKIRKIDE